MQTRKSKSEPSIAEAAENTGLLIRGLQSRLLEGAGEVAEHSPDTSGDTSGDLDQQLQEYFACGPGEYIAGSGPLGRIRNRVIDGVAERILRGWQQDGKAQSFEKDVIARLVDGVFEMLIADANGSPRKGARFPAGANSSTAQLPA